MIIIKPFVHRGHKVPGPGQYENRDITSSLSLEIPADATKEEIDTAVDLGRDMLERIDKDVVQPDMARKEGPSKVIEPRDEIVTRSALAVKLRLGKGSDVTTICQAIKDKKPFSGVENDWWIEKFTHKYNEQKEQDDK